MHLPWLVVTQQAQKNIWYQMCPRCPLPVMKIFPLLCIYLIFCALCNAWSGGKGNSSTSSAIALSQADESLQVFEIQLFKFFFLKCGMDNGINVLLWLLESSPSQSSCALWWFCLLLLLPRSGLNTRESQFRVWTWVVINSYLFTASWVVSSN